MTPARFLLSMLGCGLACAAAVAGFSVLVDPHLIFNRPRVAGFNAVKPASETRERLMKAYQVMRVAPRTVVVGTSRSDIGMDPASKAWPEAMRPVYNLSVVGAGLGTSVRFLEHLAATRHELPMPQNLVVGLDFENFFLYRIKAAGRSAPRRADIGSPSLAQESDERFEQLALGETLPRGRVLQDMGRAIFTVDGLVDSINSVMASRSDSPLADLLPDGRLSDRRLRQWNIDDGVEVVFNQKNVDTLRQYREPLLVLSEVPGGPMPEMAQVRALIAFARQHKMKLLLAVQPTHMSRLELLDHLGYWPEFERWKRVLTEIVADAVATQADVTLWDFAGFEPLVREPMPQGRQRSAPLQFFWDPVHYSAALGDVLIATMLGNTTAPPFGAVLTPATVETRLQQVRQGREEFRRLQPEDARAIRRLYCTNSRVCASTDGSAGGG